MLPVTAVLALGILPFATLAGSVTLRGPSAWQTRSFSLDALNEHHRQLKRQAWGLSQPGTTGRISFFPSE